MDAETVRILRQILEVQLEQGDLLRRFARSAASHEVNAHLDFSHGGNGLRDKSRPEMDRIEEHIDRNQEKLRELVTELYKPPAPATV